MKPGCVSKNCEQIRQVSVAEDKKSIYLYAVSYRQDARPLDGPIFELDITSPQPDIIRVQMVHFKGDRQKYARFELDDQACAMDVTDDEAAVTIKSGDTSLVITKRPCTFTYYYKGKKITAVGDRFGSPMLSYITTPEGPQMRCQLEVGIGEKIYGLGERFTPFVKNGQTIDIWNEDGGTSSEISYKNIPFYVTNRNYGVFVNDPGPVSYEVCTEAVTKVQFSLPGEKIDFMVIGGDGVKGVLKNYTALSGRPALPPIWTFGLWLSTSFTTSYDEQTVTSFIDGMAERDIPLSVFHFDCFWMRESEWCGFDWDKAMFPDVEGLLSRIKAKGLKICVWINPYIGQKSPAFTECMEKGYLLKRPNGDVWQWDLWQGGLGIIDFTNPGAVEWYKDKLRGLMVQGVDAFKTDFGERIPTDVVYYDGSEPVRMHNYYTYLYNKVVFEVIEEVKGKGEACLFARSATTGGQKFPVHWGGDCNSTFPSMSESLRGGLSLCMSGFGFWSHDIGGFEGTAPASVYKRWLAFGLLSTHSRLHGSDSYRVPWMFGEESVDVCRYFSKLKNRLIPYIFTNAVETSQTGVPSMRAMVMEFDDLGCEDCDRQYMLGDALLVAPVLSEEGDVDYYLPAGTWTHLLSGEVRQGGGWTRDNYDYFSLPLYVRQNSILPFGACDSTHIYDYADGLELRVYSMTDGGDASRTVCDKDGKSIIEMTASRRGSKITINLSGKIDKASVVLMGIKSVSGITGANAADSDNGVVLTQLSGKIEIEL